MHDDMREARYYLAVADKFLSLADGGGFSRSLVWDPLPRVIDPPTVPFLESVTVNWSKFPVRFRPLSGWFAGVCGRPGRRPLASERPYGSPN